MGMPADGTAVPATVHVGTAGGTVSTTAGAVLAAVSTRITATVSAGGGTGGSERDTVLETATEHAAASGNASIAARRRDDRKDGAGCDGIGGAWGGGLRTDIKEHGGRRQASPHNPLIQQ
jgi:hypothetical protein